MLIMYFGISLCHLDLLEPAFILPAYRCLGFFTWIWRSASVAWIEFLKRLLIFLARRIYSSGTNLNGSLFGSEPSLLSWVLDLMIFCALIFLWAGVMLLLVLTPAGLSSSDSMNSLESTDRVRLRLRPRFLVSSSAIYSLSTISLSSSLPSSAFAAFLSAASSSEPIVRLGLDLDLRLSLLTSIPVDSKWSIISSTSTR